MNDNDALIREYYRLKPTQFTILRSIAMTQGVGARGICEQSLSVVLSKELGDRTPSLRLTFHGVRNLVFEQPDWSQISIGHLEIMAGRDGQNVHGNYLVRDPDQERIVQFECDDFDAILEPA